MAFSKLKAFVGETPHWGLSQSSSFRKAAARTYDDLWPAVGNVCGLFTPEECYNFFVAAGYQTD